MVLWEHWQVGTSPVCKPITNTTYDLIYKPTAELRGHERKWKHIRGYQVLGSFHAFRSAGVTINFSDNKKRGRWNWRFRQACSIRGTKISFSKHWKIFPYHDISVKNMSRSRFTGVSLFPLWSIQYTCAFLSSPITCFYISRRLEFDRRSVQWNHNKYTKDPSSSLFK